ncbi:hypothetical protein [Kitasatospora sp. NPDC089509]|uniref:hypothetical protein n=1 Tax=Kitasatospora sp. NPDC089509 TaxID=3364079 RepID=UPI00381458EA
MTTFAFRNDASIDVAEYARYCGLMEAAAPLVADLSGLALPQRIVACPVTPEQFVKRQVEDAVLRLRRALDGVPEGLLADTMATAMLDQSRITVERMVSRFYPTCRAAVLVREDGLELTFMPEVYDRHLHPSERQLTTIFAHEITHLAQLALRPELAVTPLTFNMIDGGAGLPHTHHRALEALVEGHGQYVERQTSKALCGQAVIGALPGEPELSEHLLELRADPAMSTNAPCYDKGEQFIAAAIEAGGHALLRLVLERDDLVPTNADLDDPSQWLTRNQAAIESATTRGMSVASA